MASDQSPNPAFNSATNYHFCMKKSESELKALIIGRSRGGLRGLQLPPPFGPKILPKKVIFDNFCGLGPQLPFSHRMVDKSSHERLQYPPPLSKISRSAYAYNS